LAIRNGDIDIVKLLLDHCADANIKTKAGITPLMFASYYGNINIVKLLLDNGAKVDIVAKNGDTALSVAQGKGYQDIVNLLKSKNQLKK
ncbi:MAG: ankyrin repeat domain-containing protein, partial [Elusimicrobiaceae bacterium]|nr:ankyrin repeat domain-containing protein [Elusimicrobiaceae bacterium]